MIIKIKEVISEGVSFANSYKLEFIDKTKMSYSTNKDNEILKIKEAIKKSIDDLEILKSKYKDGKEFINIHQMIINDPILLKEVIELINNKSYDAKTSFSIILEKYIETFKNAETIYLEERALDMLDIKRRVLNHLEDSSYRKIRGKFICIVDEFYPSLLFHYKNQIVGVIAKKGGFTSHSAILCKSREIPYVLIDEDINHEGKILLDTRKKIITLDPEEDVVNDYYSNINSVNLYSQEELKEYDISVFANVSSSFEIDKVVEYNMDGIGLYRTEFIFMNYNKPMTVEEQIVVYKKAVESMKNKPITFRTFDIGDDKNIDYIKTSKKGIENYINNPQIFEDQIEALLKSNINNSIKLMFPMIETYEEFLYLKNWVLKIKDRINDDSKIKIGMMLETKKAIENLNTFKDLDFISIGTNDLTKELYHINREEMLNYTSFIKELLKTIKNIVLYCDDNNIELSICGELASVDKVAIMLYKIGIRNYSVSTGSLKIFNNVISGIIDRIEEE